MSKEVVQSTCRSTVDASVALLYELMTKTPPYAARSMERTIDDDGEMRDDADKQDSSGEKVQNLSQGF